MYIITILSVCSVAASSLGPFGWELTGFGYQLSQGCITATGDLIQAHGYRISISTCRSIKSEVRAAFMIQILRERERERERWWGSYRLKFQHCFSMYELTWCKKAFRNIQHTLPAGWYSTDTARLVGIPTQSWLESKMQYQVHCKENTDVITHNVPSVQLPDSQTGFSAQGQFDENCHNWL